MTGVNPVTHAAGMKRGDIVEWDWPETGIGMNARDRNLRPVGRVVTREDLPNMSDAEGPICIQLLDDPFWLISPVTMDRKNNEMRKVPS